MNYLLVVGSQRSGTTLMGQILGAHPQAVLIDENDGLYKWTKKLINKAKETDSQDRFHRCCLSAKTKYQNPQTRFFENGMLRENIKYTVLKAPNLTYSYKDIPEIFPNAKIIYMIRDIRDVVSSMIALTSVPMLRNQLRYIFSFEDLERIFPTELALLREDDITVKPHIKMALVVKIKTSLLDKFSETGFEVTKVKYEDLITQPDQVIPHILEQINMPYAEECLNHDQVLKGKGPGGTRRNRPVDSNSKEKWKKNLTQEQGNEIWDTVGDFMENLGYTR
jgi:LPS sulfotransferase NodH